MPSNLCSACGNASPTPLLACEDCKETKDTFETPTPTYYCSTRCRSNDRSNHATTCRNNISRTRLIRAGSMLQGTFLMAFRYACWDRKIDRVRKKDGILHFFEGHYDHPPTDGPAYPFPRDIVPDVEDSAPLLAYLACDDAIGYMFELSKELLGDLTTTIEEVKLRIKKQDHPWRVVHHDAHGHADLRRYGHAALAVECIDGEAYIIDLTGAQFGQCSPVVPFDEYMSRYAERLNHIHPHGTERNDQIAIRKGERNYEHDARYDYRIYHFHHKVHGFMLLTQKHWEEENKTTLKKLLEKNEKGYHDGMISWVGMATAWLTGMVEVWTERGCKLDQHPTQCEKCAEKKRREHEAVGRCSVKEGSRAHRRWVEDEEKRKEEEKQAEERGGEEFMGPDFMERFLASMDNLNAMVAMGEL